MGMLLESSRWQIRSNWDLGVGASHLIDQDSCRSKRSGDAKPFVAGCKPNRIVSMRGPNKGQFIGGCGPESRPAPHDGKLREAWHVGLCSAQHPSQHVGIDLSVLSSILPRRPDEDLASSSRLNIEGH